jgi:hypothetical protein
MRLCVALMILLPALACAGDITWTNFGPGGGGWIQSIAFDPRDADTLYVCGRELYDRSVEPPQMRLGGLFRSVDGGKTWERLHDFHFASCVAVSPVSSDIIHLGTTDHPYHDDCRVQGVLKSSDGGKTWRQEVEGMSSWHVSCMAIDPRDPSRLYVGVGGNAGFIGVDAAVRQAWGGRGRAVAVTATGSGAACGTRRKVSS